MSAIAVRLLLCIFASQVAFEATFAVAVVCSVMWSVGLCSPVMSKIKFMTSSAMVVRSKLKAFPTKLLLIVVLFSAARSKPKAFPTELLLIVILFSTARSEPSAFLSKLLLIVVSFSASVWIVGGSMLGW